MKLTIGTETWWLVEEKSYVAHKRQEPGIFYWVSNNVRVTRPRKSKEKSIRDARIHTCTKAGEKAPKDEKGFEAYSAAQIEDALKTEEKADW